MQTIIQYILIILDVKDGGAAHIASTVREIKNRYLILKEYFIFYFLG